MLRTWRMFLAWILLCLAGWSHGQSVLFLSSDGSGDSFTNSAFNAFKNSPEVQALGGLRDARGQLSRNSPDKSLFNGARLVVLTTTYARIHPNWVNALREVMFTRPDLTFVMFPDGCCEVPSNLAPLVKIIADGTQWPLGTSGFSSAEIRSPLNRNSLYADTFRDLDPLVGGAYSLVTNVPSDNALYLPQGASAPATGTTTSAYGFFVPQKGFNAGQGACLFLTADISGFHGAYSAQHAKIASAFMQAATDTVNGACAKSTRAPDLTVKLTGPERLSMGAAHPFTITVHNEGASDSQDGLLDVSLPAGLLLQTASLPLGCSAIPTGLQCALPPLPADTGSLTLSFEATPQQMGAITVSAAASEVKDETNLANNSDSLTLSVVGPDLSIQLAGPEDARAGDPVTLTATIHNAGPADSLPTTVHLPLPDGWTVQPLPDGCALQADALVCDIPALDAGTEFELPVPLLPAGDGLVTLTASIPPAPGEDDQGNNTDTWQVTITPAPADSTLQAVPATAPGGIALLALLLAGLGSRARNNARGQRAAR